MHRPRPGHLWASLDTAINGGSLSDNLDTSLEDAIAHTASAALFNAVGDFAADPAIDWPDGSPQKIALHALAGGLVSEAMGGDFRDGAMAAGASEALVGRLIDDVAENPALTNAVAQLVGLTAAGLSGGDVQQGAWVANQADRYNRQLHPQEHAMLADEADALEERLGQPQLQGVTWQDMLTLASGASLDAQAAQQFNELLTQLEGTNANNPLYQDFQHDLLQASQSIAALAEQNTALTWQDGESITAYGDPVIAFQVTPRQYQDADLFGSLSSNGLLDGANTAWRQFGVGQSTDYQEDIAGFASSAPQHATLNERLGWLVSDGIQPDTTDVDIALTLAGGAGARKAIEWLRSRVMSGEFTKGAARVPGRVQSRINLSNDGIKHTLGLHLNPTKAGNKSQFTLPESELRSLLGAKSTVQAPAQALETGNFARTVTTNRTVGNLAEKMGGGSTNTFTVITDKFGNLQTAFPGGL
ncbi:DUF637 domain-containing protein [Halomonas sp. GXIMD04776]|uniref:DUF637 domain-containing protein n=1 Tax=Halomonas sp. GXIMD04776 TaxID=3415605 RepID=UPI003CAC678F